MLLIGRLQCQPAYKLCLVVQPKRNIRSTEFTNICYMICSPAPAPVKRTDVSPTAAAPESANQRLASESLLLKLTMNIWSYFVTN